MEDYLDDHGSMTGDRSDILIEEAMQKAQVDAGRRYNRDKKIYITIYYAPQTEQPDTTVRTVYRSKISWRSLKAVKKGPPRTLGDVGPRTLAPL